MRSRVYPAIAARFSLSSWAPRREQQIVSRHNDLPVPASALSALTCGMSPQCSPLGRSASSEHLCALPFASAAGPFAGGKPRWPPQDGPAHRGLQRLSATRGQLPPGWYDVTTCLPPLRVPGDLWGAVNVSWTAISSVLSPTKCTEPQPSSRAISTRVRCATPQPPSYALHGRQPFNNMRYTRRRLQVMSAGAPWYHGVHGDYRASASRMCCRRPKVLQRRQTLLRGHPRRPASFPRHCGSGLTTGPRSIGCRSCRHPPAACPSVLAVVGRGNACKVAMVLHLVGCY